MSDSEKPEKSTIATLAELSTRMEGTLAMIEPKFVRLGETLQAVYADADALSKMAKQTTSHMGGEQVGGLEGDVEALVGQALDKLQSSRSTIEGHLTKSATITENLGALRNVSALIERNGRFLRIIGINIAIESSRSSESIALFSDFGREIKTLAVNVSRIAGRINAAAVAAGARQAEAEAEIVAGLTQLGGLSESAEEAVRQSIGEIRSLMSVSANAFENAAEHSREIFTQVGEIVMAIQFHDIVRQQVEHVLSAFDDVKKVLSDGAFEKGGEQEKEGCLGKAHAILNLQFEQMKFIAGEVENAYDSTMAAFGRIGDEAGLLMAGVSHAGMADTGGDAIEGQYRSLKGGLDNLHQLISQAGGLGGRIDENIHEACRAAGTLSQFADQVKEVSTELKFKALNAIIMTKQLGSKGNALGVLAGEVGGVSGRSGEFVGQVLDNIAEITRLGEDRELQAESADEEIVRALESGIGRFTAVFDNYRRDAGKTAEGTLSLKEAVQNVRKDLDFFPDVLERMAVNRDTLEKAVLALAPWAGRGTEDAASEAHMAEERYTMESEREIHRRAMIGKGADAGAGTSGEAMDVELFGEDESDVELFDEGSGGDVELFDEGSGGDVELFGEGSDGDVELFDEGSGGDVELFDEGSGGDVELFGEGSGGDVELFDEGGGRDLKRPDEGEEAHGRGAAGTDRDEPVKATGEESENKVLKVKDNRGKESRRPEKKPVDDEKDRGHGETSDRHHEEADDTVLDDNIELF